MLRVSGLAFALVMLLAAAGCASRADLERLKRDQQELRARVADLQVSVDSINRRLDSARSSAADRGGGPNAAAVRTLERRLAELEARLAAAPPPADTGGTPPPVSPTAEPAPPSMPRTEAANIALRREDRQPASSANAAYRRALQSYRDGQPDQAIEQFREFLRANPKSDLADSAQYWIGEAYFSKGDYSRSIIALNEVLEKYPQGDQVPGALLALATAFSRTGDPIDAKLILQKLITEHPKSEEAEIARQQLRSLPE